ncbi:hypothetical protein EYF80_045196 [Liparis tanakae]|uniref:Uncharacterized protein n=1 Tax=Liparis tanakae TaxID=230148 RepID=A0A4Z2FVA1_9TELE|nr:hypothetical protein EYF80_045196 [Liparis tanakae]
MNCCPSPYGEEASGRQFGGVRPGPADDQLDQRLALRRGSEPINPVQSGGERETDGWRGASRGQGHRPACIMRGVVWVGGSCSVRRSRHDPHDAAFFLFGPMSRVELKHCPNTDCKLFLEAAPSFRPDLTASALPRAQRHVMALQLRGVFLPGPPDPGLVDV